MSILLVIGLLLCHFTQTVVAFTLQNPIKNHRTLNAYNSNRGIKISKSA